MSEPLKLCECGWARTKLTDPFLSMGYRGKWSAKCPCCPASTTWYATEAEAIAAWNRRAPAALPTREEVLEAVAFHLDSRKVAEAITDAVMALMGKPPA